MKTAWVKAGREGPVPLKSSPRTYITEDQPRLVELDPYYRRRIRTGELLALTETEAKKLLSRARKAAEAEAPAEGGN